MKKKNIKKKSITIKKNQLQRKVLPKKRNQLLKIKKK